MQSGAGLSLGSSQGQPADSLRVLAEGEGASSSVFLSSSAATVAGDWPDVDEPVQTLEHSKLEGCFFVMQPNAVATEQPRLLAAQVLTSGQPSSNSLGRPAPKPLLWRLSPRCIRTSTEEVCITAEVSLGVAPSECRVTAVKEGRLLPVRVDFLKDRQVLMRDEDDQPSRQGRGPGGLRAAAVTGAAAVLRRQAAVNDHSSASLQPHRPDSELVRIWLTPGTTPGLVLIELHALREPPASTTAGSARTQSSPATTLLYGGASTGALHSAWHTGLDPTAISADPVLQRLRLRVDTQDVAPPAGVQASLSPRTTQLNYLSDPDMVAGVPGGGGDPSSLHSQAGPNVFGYRTMCSSGALLVVVVPDAGMEEEVCSLLALQHQQTPLPLPTGELQPGAADDMPGELSTMGGAPSLRHAAQPPLPGQLNPLAHGGAQSLATGGGVTGGAAAGSAATIATCGAAPGVATSACTMPAGAPTPEESASNCAAAAGALGAAEGDEDQDDARARERFLWDLGAWLNMAAQHTAYRQQRASELNVAGTGGGDSGAMSLHFPGPASLGAGYDQSAPHRAHLEPSLQTPPHPPQLRSRQPGQPQGRVLNGLRSVPDIEPEVAASLDATASNMGEPVEAYRRLPSGPVRTTSAAHPFGGGEGSVPCIAVELLGFACSRGWAATSTHIVLSLMDQGHYMASINASVQRAHGWSALHLAVASGSAELVAMMALWRSYGRYADRAAVQEEWRGMLALPGPGGLTPLHLAAVLPQPASVALDLLSCMSAETLTTWFGTPALDGCTPAHYASRAGNSLFNDHALLCLATGAASLDLASEQGLQEVLPYLGDLQLDASSVTCTESGEYDIIAPSSAAPVPDVPRPGSGAGQGAGGWLQRVSLLTLGGGSGWASVEAPRSGQRAPFMAPHAGLGERGNGSARAGGGGSGAAATPHATGGALGTGSTSAGDQCCLLLQGMEAQGTSTAEPWFSISSAESARTHGQSSPSSGRTAGRSPLNAPSERGVGEIRSRGPYGGGVTPLACTVSVTIPGIRGGLASDCTSSRRGQERLGVPLTTELASEARGGMAEPPRLAGSAISERPDGSDIAPRALATAGRPSTESATMCSGVVDHPADSSSGSAVRVTATAVAVGPPQSLAVISLASERPAGLQPSRVEPGVRPASSVSAPLAVRAASERLAGSRSPRAPPSAPRAFCFKWLPRLVMGGLSCWGGGSARVRGGEDEVGAVRGWRADSGGGVTREEPRGKGGATVGGEAAANNGPLRDRTPAASYSGGTPEVPSGNSSGATGWALRRARGETGGASNSGGGASPSSQPPVSIAAAGPATPCGLMAAGASGGPEHSSSAELTPGSLTPGSLTPGSLPAACGAFGREAGPGGPPSLQSATQPPPGRQPAEALLPASPQAPPAGLPATSPRKPPYGPLHGPCIRPPTPARSHRRTADPASASPRRLPDPTAQPCPESAAAHSLLDPRCGSARSCAAETSPGPGEAPAAPGPTSSSAFFGTDSLHPGGCSPEPWLSPRRGWLEPAQIVAGLLDRVSPGGTPSPRSWGSPTAAPALGPLSKQASPRPPGWVAAGADAAGATTGADAAAAPPGGMGGGGGGGAVGGRRCGVDDVDRQQVESDAFRHPMSLAEAQKAAVRFITSAAAQAMESRPPPGFDAAALAAGQAFLTRTGGSDGANLALVAAMTLAMAEGAVEGQEDCWSVRSEPAAPGVRMLSGTGSVRLLAARMAVPVKELIALMVRNSIHQRQVAHLRLQRHLRLMRQAAMLLTQQQQRLEAGSGQPGVQQHHRQQQQNPPLQQQQQQQQQGQGQGQMQQQRQLRLPRLAQLSQLLRNQEQPQPPQDPRPTRRGRGRLLRQPPSALQPLEPRSGSLGRGLRTQLPGYTQGALSRRQQGSKRWSLRWLQRHRALLVVAAEAAALPGIAGHPRTFVTVFQLYGVMLYTSFALARTAGQAAGGL